MEIRLETPVDYAAIYDFVKTAFATAKVTNGAEQDFVNDLRDGHDYIPELAFVLEDRGKIAGHIMLSRVYLINGDLRHEALLLAPVAVALEHRDHGLGAQLINHAMDTARAMGHKAVLLVGDRNYYQRFGFVPASRFGIKFNLELPADLVDNVMAYELVPGGLDGVHGTMELD